MKINDLLNIKSNYSNDEKKIILSFLLDLPKLDLFKLEEITDKKVINKSMCKYANWILSSEKSISIGIFGTLSNWHIIIYA